MQKLFFFPVMETSLQDCLVDFLWATTYSKVLYIYILRKTERFCIYYVSCPLDLCKMQNLGLQNLSYEVGNLSFFRFCLQSRVRKLSCQCIQDYSSSNWPNHTLISLLDYDGRKKHVIQTWYLWVLWRLDEMGKIGNKVLFYKILQMADSVSILSSLKSHETWEILISSIL